MKCLFVAALASILLAGQASATVVKIEDTGINDGVHIEQGTPGFGSSGPVTLDWGDPLGVDASSLRSYPLSGFSGRPGAWCGEASSATCVLDITVDSGFSVTLTSFFLGVFGADMEVDYSVVDLFDNSLIISIANAIVTDANGKVVDVNASSTVGFRIIFGNDWNVGINDITYDFASISSVPLPAALPLLGAGLAGLVLLGRRNKRKAPAIAA